jgi:hypothetical protein
MDKRTGTAPARRGRAVVVAVATVLALAAAGCGRDGGQAAPPTTPPAPTSTTSAASTTTLPRGAPRWETVTTLTGSGPAEPPAFNILADSIQWRVRWTCETGQLRITTDPPPRRPAPLVDAACPGAEPRSGFAIVTGDVRLKIEASGPWKVIVDQQIDTPLNEPPPDGLAAAAAKQGAFYNVEKEAKGAGRILKRPDGTAVLRLEDFEVSTNVDLFIWLSEAPAPKTSAEAVGSPYKVLGNLRSTLGNQNYAIPADMPVDKVQSIVIWCEPIRIAYGAAALA